MFFLVSEIVSEVSKYSERLKEILRDSQYLQRFSEILGGS